MNVSLHSPPRKISSSFFCLAILGIGLAVYANSLNGGFKWDDHHLVEENRSIRTWHHTFQNFTRPLKQFPTYYRPTQMLSYQCDYLLWGSHPTGYHLSNLLLHLINALLFFFLLNLALQNRHAAFWGALLFCCHPALSEPVNYISSRSDLLVGTFTLLTMIFAFKRYLILAMISFALSLLSKEIALVTPFVLLAWQGVSTKNIKKTAPFFLIALLFLLLRRAIIPPGPTTHLPAWVLFSAPYAFMKYLLALAYPQEVAKTWSIPLVTSLSQKEFLLPLLGALVFGCLTAVLCSRSKQAFFGIMWFLISLLPFLFSPYVIPTLEGFPFSYAWLYLPSLGFFFSVSSLAASWALTPGLKRALKILLPCVLLVLGGITIKTNAAWTTSEMDFIRHILRHRSGSVSGPVSSGMDPTTQALSPLSLNYIGAILERQNKPKEALRYYQESLRIDPRNSNTHFNLGVIHLKEGNRRGAKEEFEKAVIGDFYNIGAHYNLAILYANDGLDDKALKEINVVLQFEPDAFKRSDTPKKSIRSY